MNESDLLVLIRGALIKLLVAQGQTDVQVVTEYQAQSQGRTNGPTVYFFQLPTTNRYGAQGFSTQYNPGTGITTRTESQWHRVQYQMQGLNDTGVGLSANDLTVLAAMLVGSRGFLQELRKEQVGIERLTEIRTPYIKNDRDRFEMTPSFDFTLSTKRTIIQQSAAIDATEFNVIRV